ncbi:MAG: hypothetical protein ACO3SP_02520 [Ilumatobacteraceae bacterium]
MGAELRRSPSDPGSEPLRIVSAGTTIDTDGVSFPTVVVDVGERPDVRDLARVVAHDGVGDLSTSGDIGMDPHGRTVIRLVARATVPVEVEFALVFPMPAYAELLGDAARTGCLVVAAAVGDPPQVDSGDWLGLDVDGLALQRMVDFAG